MHRQCMSSALAAIQVFWLQSGIRLLSTLCARIHIRRSGVFIKIAAGYDRHDLCLECTEIPAKGAHRHGGHRGCALLCGKDEASRAYQVNALKL